MMPHKHNHNTVIHSMESFLPITATWLYNLIKSHDSFDPVVICTQVENKTLFPLPHVHCPKNELVALPDVINKVLIRSMGLNFSPYAYFFARKERPAIWHSHFGTRAVYDMELVKRLQIPQVVTFYGLDASWVPKKQPEWRNRYLRLFHSVSKVLAEGNHFKRVLEDLGCPSRKVIVQRIGVDEENISFKPRKFKKGDTLRLMTVGTFREKKGIPYIVHALSKAKRSYPNISLSLYGDANEGKKRDEDEKRRILETVSDLGLEDSVDFKGYVPFDRIFEDCYFHHLLVQPSVTASDGDTEGGFPVIISEMLASGMPVISTFHCDIPEVVLDKKSGLLSPERDATSLADHILFFVNNPDAFETYAHAGREHVEENYSLKKQAQSLERIYKDIIAEHKTNLKKELATDT